MSDRIMLQKQKLTATNDKNPTIIVGGAAAAKQFEQNVNTTGNSSFRSPFDTNANSPTKSPLSPLELSSLLDDTLPEFGLELRNHISLTEYDANPDDEIDFPELKDLQELQDNQHRHHQKQQQQPQQQQPPGQQQQLQGQQHGQEPESSQKHEKAVISNPPSPITTQIVDLKPSSSPQQQQANPKQSSPPQEHQQDVMSQSVTRFAQNDPVVTESSMFLSSSFYSNTSCTSASTPSLEQTESKPINKYKQSDSDSQISTDSTAKPTPTDTTMPETFTPSVATVMITPPKVHVPPQSPLLLPSHMYSTQTTAKTILEAITVFIYKLIVSLLLGFSVGGLLCLVGCYVHYGDDYDGRIPNSLSIYCAFFVTCLTSIALQWDT